MMRLSGRARLVGILVLFFAVLVVRHRVAGMDERWFPLSWEGVQGLARYAGGDLSGAARAYRADLQREARAAGDTVQPVTDLLALLRGDAAEAARLAREALRRDPDDVGALLTLGQLELDRDAPREALVLLARVHERAPDQFDAWLLEAAARARLREFDRATDALKRALRTDTVEARRTSFLTALAATGDLDDLPAEGQPRCLLAHFHRYLRIYDEARGGTAIRYAEEAIKRGNRPGDAHLTIGVVHLRQGRSSPALDSFSSAIAADPANAEASRWASQVYRQRGDLAAVHQALRAAFDASGREFFYAEELYRFLVGELGDYPAAVTLAREMRVMRPQDIRGTWHLAEASAQMGEYEGAVALYREALVLAPDNAELLAGLGGALEGMKRLDESLATFERAAVRAPGWYEPRRRRANILLFRKRYEEAAREFEAALRLADPSPHTLAGLCHAYQGGRDQARTEQCFGALRRWNPDAIVPVPSLPEVLNNMRGPESG